MHSCIAQAQTVRSAFERVYEELHKPRGNMGSEAVIAWWRLSHKEGRSRSGQSITLRHQAARTGADSKRPLRREAPGQKNKYIQRITLGSRTDSG